MVEIAGIDITRVVWVIITLAASFLIARIVSRILARIFEKTPGRYLYGVYFASMLIPPVVVLRLTLKLLLAG
jgi:uncharacterized membrane protein